MTGLYENIEELQNEKNLTFLYRAPKIYLQSLNLGSIAENYQQTLSVSLSVSRMMAGLTMGYPLAFQCLGYCVWENNREFDRSIQTQVRQLLEESAYEIIWARLSAKDQQVAYGIARSATGAVQEIRAFLGMETNQFNPYRRRLIRKGLILGDEWGKVRFALPFFDAFVLDMMED